MKNLTASFVNGALTENERRHQEALKRGSPKALRTARERAKKAAQVTVTPVTGNSPPVISTAPSTPIVTGNQAPPKPATRKRRYALVFDVSGSMQSIKRGAIKMANAIQNQLLLEDADGATIVSTYYFGSRVETGVRNYVPKGLKPVTDWPDLGMTALYSAVIQASKELEESAGPDDTFCIITVTDGGENASGISSQRFRDEVQTRQRTDRFTYVFNLPIGSCESFARLTGLPAGNMQEWSDVGQVEKAVVSGISAYTQATRGGANSVKNFLLNANTLTIKDFDSCPDIKPQVKVWHVDKAQRINEFVESHNVTFQPGRSYYQLTKDEKVEEGKEIIVLEKTFAPNGQRTVEKVCGNARAVLQQKLGLPAGEIRKITPANLGNLEIYIQSTSNNRNLVPGTRLIYVL